MLLAKHKHHLPRCVEVCSHRHAKTDLTISQNRRKRTKSSCIILVHKQAGYHVVWETVHKFFILSLLSQRGSIICSLNAWAALCLTNEGKLEQMMPLSSRSWGLGLLNGVWHHLFVSSQLISWCSFICARSLVQWWHQAAKVCLWKKLNKLF